MSSSLGPAAHSMARGRCRLQSSLVAARSAQHAHSRAHACCHMQVAEALAERAKRVYEKYGTVMVNLEGFSRVGGRVHPAAATL